MEDQPDHLHGNAVFHGNPVPGSYDPADLYLRWNIWNPEPQSNIDIHASGLLGIYGGIHVPWIYQRRCTDLWNDYLLPSLILTDKSLYTIPIATKLFQGTYSNDMDLLMAALVMAIIPVIILYIALQKYIIAGVVAGAVKS